MEDRMRVFRSNYNPMFRSQFSETIFKQKYAHEGCETWADLSRTLVEDVCRDQLSKEDKDQLTNYITDLKFLPGGRYLYYAGRPRKFFNNCFGGEVKAVTKSGLKTLKEIYYEQELGHIADFLSPVDGVYYPAKVYNHGKQQLYKITFKPVRGNSTVSWTVRATRNHRWPLTDGTITTNLKIGDCVPSNTFSSEIDELGFAHGFVFGDGTRNGQLRLCADKDLVYLEQLAKVAHSVTYPSFADGDPMLYFNQKIDWKSLPDASASPSYKAGFILGWIAADGCENRMLHSIRPDYLEWFAENAYCAGITLTGKLSYQDRDVKIGDYQYLAHRIYRQHFTKKPFEFKVVSIEEDALEDVYCPLMPVFGKFVLENNMQTGNCFLLKAEEDTRQDWANLSWKAESCLMTGGGIGVDYSVYRASGKRLESTGGLASGPIPKMQMINEIGRHVMQGGSRRSAIYASLNWQHGDVEKFLYCKDWHSMPVGSSGLSVWDLKSQDFNFNAPLDMTNISLNYDTKWLMNYWQTGEVGETFEANVAQALKTGEPGFSFNFFNKEEETLRNAPVSKDTWVLTHAGYRQVADLIGEQTVVWTGQQWAETTFNKTKENVQTVSVEMSGGRAIKADPEHEFFVERWSGKGRRKKLLGISKVPASELKVGDILHTSLPQITPAPFDVVTYLLGYTYGDGSFSKVRDRAEITFCSPESQKVVEDLKLNSINVDNISYINWSDSRNFIRVYLKNHSYHLRQKEVFPSDVKPSDLNSFIAGLFDADGSYDPVQHRIRVSSVHYSFLEGVRRALENLGIQSSINKAGVSTYGQKIGYNLTVLGSSVNRFIDVVPTQRLKPKKYSPYRKSTIKVLSVNPGPIEDVYCCDVGVEEHSFCAEGVIISNCCEVTSADDSDVCNLGSVNLGRIDNVVEFSDVVDLASKFLLLGTLRADLPYQKVYQVREKNRRLGLGLMGMHEWLIKRGSRYEVTPELHRWLAIYKSVSEHAATRAANHLGISVPVAFRAIAPTGSIGILAGTSTGIEPVYAVAYKRRYLVGTTWKYQYEVDGVARELSHLYGVNPDTIESAVDLAADFERRVAFQADVQDYVDMAISSTINLPAFGTELNNEDMVKPFANTLAKYAHRLRGFTCFPDGSRGGQPLTSVPFSEAVENLGTVFEEHVATNDVCDIRGGGTCGQ